MMQLERQTEMAYNLTKEKGQIGAILLCEEMIQDRRGQINQLKSYDKDVVSDLQDSIMNWGAIQSIVKKGFPSN